MVVAGRFSDWAFWLLSRVRSGGLARGGTGLIVLGWKSEGAAFAYAPWFDALLAGDFRELEIVGGGLSRERILLGRRRWC